MPDAATSPVFRPRNAGPGHRQMPRRGLGASFDMLARLIGQSYGVALLGPFADHHHPDRRNAGDRDW